MAYSVRPDKGWAWMVCCAVFLWNNIVGGTFKIQGLLFIEYLELFKEDEKNTSWISFTLGITEVVFAPIGGYLADSLSHNNKRLFITASYIISALCVALAGYLPNLPPTVVMFALLGACIGLQDPIALSMIGRYFSDLRTLAYGIAFTGSSTGSIVFPHLFTGLSSKYAFRGTMLIFSATWLHALFIPAVTWPISNPSKSEEPAAVCLDRSSSTPKKGNPAVLYVNQAMGLNEVHRKENDALNADAMDENGRRVSVTYDGDTVTIMDGTSNPDEKTDGKEEWTLDQEELVEITNNLPKNISLMKKTNRNRCFQIVGIFKHYVKFVRTPKIPLLLLSLWFGMFSGIGGYFLIPLLSREYGRSKQETSWMLTTASLAEVVTKVIAGLLVDRARAPKGAILIVSYIGYGVGGIVLSFINNPYALYGYAAVVGGFGNLVIGLAIPMVLDIVDDSQKGVASSMVPTLMGLSAALVPVTLGAVKTRYGSYTEAMWASSAAALIGIIFYFSNKLVSRILKCARSNKFTLKH